MQLYGCRRHHTANRAPAALSCTLSAPLTSTNTRRPAHTATARPSSGKWAVRCVQVHAVSRWTWTPAGAPVASLSRPPGLLSHVPGNLLHRHATNDQGSAFSSTQASLCVLQSLELMKSAKRLMTRALNTSTLTCSPDVPDVRDEDGAFIQRRNGSLQV